MPNYTQHFSPTVLTYARVVLELAIEQDKLDAVQEELEQVRTIFEQNPDLVTFLSDPAIGRIQRSNLVERTFQGHVSALVWNFLRVLNERNALKQLIEIVKAFRFLADRQRGRIDVELTVAQVLDEQQLESVRQRISSALKKDAMVHQHVDEAVIGGLVLQIEDQLVDASVRHQLIAIRQQLLAARPR